MKLWLGLVLLCLVLVEGVQLRQLATKQANDMFPSQKLKDFLKEHKPTKQKFRDAWNSMVNPAEHKPDEPMVPTEELSTKRIDNFVRLLQKMGSRDQLSVAMLDHLDVKLADLQKGSHDQIYEEKLNECARLLDQLRTVGHKPDEPKVTNAKYFQQEVDAFIQLLLKLKVPTDSLSEELLDMFAQQLDFLRLHGKILSVSDDELSNQKLAECDRLLAQIRTIWTAAKNLSEERIDDFFLLLTNVQKKGPAKYTETLLDSYEDRLYSLWTGALDQLSNQKLEECAQLLDQLKTARAQYSADEHKVSEEEFAQNMPDEDAPLRTGSDDEFAQVSPDEDEDAPDVDEQ